MSNNLYCLTCRKRTGNVSPHEVTKGGRRMMQAKCSICGRKKSQFIRSSKGGRVYSTRARGAGMRRKKRGRGLFDILGSFL